MITVGTRKLTLVDYSLVPDIAIVDPTLTLTMPPGMTADTGLDALTHALEAAVSIFASPYTDAFCVQAARLIFDALPRAVADGSDIEARADMANAATIAGLAFSNAFVGVNHALAHAVGARFDIPHGRANAIFLPHVMRYNASIPTKFMPAPGYSAYVAPEKYATLGWILFGGRTEEERRDRLFTPGRRAHRHRRRSPHAEGGRCGGVRVRGRPARPGPHRLRRPQPAHQPPHADDRRDRRTAAPGLRRPARTRVSAGRLTIDPGRNHQ